MKLPEAFVEQTKLLLGDEALLLLAALDETAPVSIRLNPAKTDGFMEMPIIERVSGSIPWSSHGLYLKERPSFTFDPLLHAGCYYVQEASSMFVEQAILKAVDCLGAVDVPIRMLDLCAAPGGKSTLALSVLPEGSLLVANEVIRARANILAENLIKWGNPNVVVTQSDSSAFSVLEDFFDIMLTDVPCSSEGLFRKAPESVSEWSPENVRLCTARQKSILEVSQKTLRPGGILIYSTCTYNTQENEENVRWLCDTFGFRLIQISVDPVWAIAGPCPFDNSPDTYMDKAPVYRFLPHKTKGEGFFLALLQKPETKTQEVSTRKKSKPKNRRNVLNEKSVLPDNVKNLISNPEAFNFFIDRIGKIRALPIQHAASFRQLEQSLRIVHAGIACGEMKGRDMLPDPSLALSVKLNRSSVQTFSIDLKQAISYLRRETMVLPEDCPLGWVLMLYLDHPLGWMKNIGNRANNAWPNEWRIRSDNPF